MNGVMLALYPSPADAKRLAIPGGEPVESLHVTLAYLGKATSVPAHEIAAAQLAGDSLSSMSGPFRARVTGHAVFDTKDGPALVALVQGPQLAVMGAAVERFRDGTHPVWVPHITLAYGESSTARASSPSSVRLDRVVLAVAGEQEVWPMGEAGRLAQMLRVSD